MDKERQEKLDDADSGANAGEAKQAAPKAVVISRLARFRRARWRRWLIGAGVVGAVVLTCSLLIGSALLAEFPTWWRTVDSMDPRTVERAYEIERWVEAHLAEKTRLDQVGQRWAVSISAQDANAWLNVRLRKWMENRDAEAMWPEDVRELQVEFRGGDVHLGARVDRDGKSRVVWATVVPEVREDGRLWLTASWINVGRLNIPAGWVLSGAPIAAVPEGAVGDELSDLPEAREMGAVFAGRRPVFREPSVRLWDGRRLRVLRVETKDGWLFMLFETEDHRRRVAGSEEGL